jgi:hypothetical protein
MQFREMPKSDSSKVMLITGLFIVSFSLMTIFLFQ